MIFQNAAVNSQGRSRIFKDEVKNAVITTFAAVTVVIIIVLLLMAIFYYKDKVYYAVLEDLEAKYPEYEFVEDSIRSNGYTVIATPSVIFVPDREFPYSIEAYDEDGVLHGFLVGKQDDGGYILYLEETEE